MKILISNDDGIESQGIQALAEAVGDFGEVTVVAPHRERSTAGHSLTLHKPLRILKVCENQFSTSGTPADCIYLGIREILKANPDLILSGINAGANLGTDVHYSGTVAAAREGALMNIRSYAFSLVDLPHPLPKMPRQTLDFSMAAKFARKVLDATKEVLFPPHTLLNVNIPNLREEEIRGIRVARQGFRYYANEVTRRTDPRGKDYYWIGGPYQGYERGETSDCQAVTEGWVSVTPITIDCTHNEFYQRLKEKDPF
jgi:5'-nucleotidase